MEILNSHFVQPVHSQPSQGNDLFNDLSSRSLEMHSSTFTTVSTSEFACNFIVLLPFLPASEK